MDITLRERNLDALFTECCNGGKIQVAANNELIHRFIGPNQQFKIQGSYPQNH